MAPQLRWKWILPVAMALLLLLVMVPRAHKPTEAPFSRARSGTYTLLPSPPPGAQQVRVGFYPLAIYDLDQASNTFYADTYVWLRWKGDIDPSTSIEFTNMVDEWGKLLEPMQEKPKILADGSKYQQFRVEGRFVQSFSMDDFPLDEHSLSIRIEDTTHGVNEMSYVIDDASSGVDQKLDIPGWRLKGWKADILNHAYGTNFGDAEPSNYSVAHFQLIIARPLSYFLWKMLMPLVIVVSTALVALLISPKSIDARLALPMGALLSAIFLQRGYSDTLPDLGYLVLMDKIYLLTYPLILAVLIRAIKAYRQGRDATGEELERIQRVDRQSILLLGSIFAVGTGCITLMR